MRTRLSFVCFPITFVTVYGTPEDPGLMRSENQGQRLYRKMGKLECPFSPVPIVSQSFLNHIKVKISPFSALAPTPSSISGDTCRLGSALLKNAGNEAIHLTLAPWEGQNCVTTFRPSWLCCPSSSSEEEFGMYVK